MDLKSCPKTHSDTDSLLAQLAQATLAVRWITSIWDGGPHPGVRISLDELQSAFASIMELQRAIEGIPDESPPGVSEALSSYRAALERLMPQLPRFEGWLLAERRRLGDRQAHATGVGNWTEAQGKTR